MHFTGDLDVVSSFNSGGCPGSGFQFHDFMIKVFKPAPKLGALLEFTHAQELDYGLISLPALERDRRTPGAPLDLHYEAAKVEGDVGH